MKKGKKILDPKFYGYIRVSTKEQTEDGLSLENQEKEIREYVKREGHVITTIFADKGKSGRTTDKREELQKVLDIMVKGDTLVVWALSRLARKVRDYTNICGDLEERGCFIVIIKEKLENITATGKFFSNITASAAQFESDLTSERVKECMKLKKEKGEFMGRISYGWMLSDGKGSDLIEHPEEQEVIKKIKDMKRDKEKVKDIIKYLDDNNIRPPHNSKKWYPNTIYRIVKRESVITKGRDKYEETEEKNLLRRDKSIF